MALNAKMIHTLMSLAKDTDKSLWLNALFASDDATAVESQRNAIKAALGITDDEDVDKAIQIYKNVKNGSKKSVGEDVTARLNQQEAIRQIKEAQAAEAGANASGLGKFYASTDPQTGTILRGVLGRAALPIAIGTTVAEAGLNYNAGRIENKANALAAAMLSRARGAHSGAFGAPERSPFTRGMMTATANEEAYGKNAALAYRTLGKVIGDTSRILTGAAATGRMIEDSVLNGNGAATALEARRKMANFSMGNNAMGNTRH